MARNFVKGCAVLIVMALASTGVRAQAPFPGGTPFEKPQDLPRVTPQASRITLLLERLADEARSSDDLAFAVRAQAQAATLLWPRDAERASSIYRRAFESLATGSPAKPGDQKADAAYSAGVGPRAELSAARKRQLRSELLNQIASRDPQLAEDLAGSVTGKIESSSRECKDGALQDCGTNASNLTLSPGARPTIASTREDTERRELLMSAALQVVEREPQQAMAFAQMSIALGISSYLARFLTLMRAVDSERADLLFSNVVARLEESPEVNLTAIHALGSYVVSVANANAEHTLSKQLVVRFLNLALDRISRDETTSQAITSRDESSAYFIGRQLTDLVALYLPERAGELQGYVVGGTVAGIGAATDPPAADGMIDPIDVAIRAPADLARDASEATDKGERDSLWARTALGWLNRDELKYSEDAALRIANESTRDRVLIQIAQRYSYARRIEDALALARRVVDLSLRADVVVMLANGALASRDEGRAIELLNEAATCSAKASLIDRARSLIKIAGGFAAFDDIRSFETLQAAIKAINETIKRQQDSKEDPASAAKPNGAPALDDLNKASLERTLAALAKSDFDRALSLAQQLSAREASIIAQLAVCKGGLVERPPIARSTNTDEVEETRNH